MTIKKQLLEEIESTPDTLLAQTLDFLRFFKTKQDSESDRTLVIEFTSQEVKTYDTAVFSLIKDSSNSEKTSFADGWDSLNSSLS